MRNAKKLTRYAIDLGISNLYRPYIQEVKSAAAEAVKELAVHEKQRVGLEERRKHANGKAKKLKKSIQEVI